eukprot:COSAG02_NODE_39319_length_418_cov_1.188088_1_plen_59_part_10
MANVAVLLDHVRGMQLSFASCRNVCKTELTIVSSWTFESRPLLMVSSGKSRSGVASPLG